MVSGRYSWRFVLVGKKGKKNMSLDLVRQTKNLTSNIVDLTASGIASTLTTYRDEPGHIFKPPCDQKRRF